MPVASAVLLVFIYIRNAAVLAGVTAVLTQSKVVESSVEIST